MKIEPRNDTVFPLESEVNRALNPEVESRAQQVEKLQMSLVFTVLCNIVPYILTNVM